jgi:hypothetical protein
MKKQKPPDTTGWYWCMKIGKGGGYRHPHACAAVRKPKCYKECIDKTIMKQRKENKNVNM